MLSGNIPSFQSSLERLDLSHNSLHGVIPDQITELVNLYVLDLSYNQLNGSIPSSIDQLLKLQQLLLSENTLCGSIPSGSIPLGITIYLSNLDLSYNMLTRLVPSDLLSHPNLLTIDLSFNNLEGSIPVNVSNHCVEKST
ncbi:putative leucine-rich repeat domain superfamily [Helianthus anomalus]